MKTGKELFARNKEIIAIFDESQMTEVKTVGTKTYTNPVYVVYPDSGDWTYTLKEPIIKDVLNRIRKKNNMPTNAFLPYGKTQLEQAEKAGDTQKAKNCRNITAVVNKEIESVLGGRYGHLIPLQAEIRANFAEMKARKEAIQELNNMEIDVDITSDSYDMDISTVI